MYIYFIKGSGLILKLKIIVIFIKKMFVYFIDKKIVLIMSMINIIGICSDFEINFYKVFLG